MSTWPLTGRSVELRAVTEALHRGGVVIAGGAGIGKTRLARAALTAMAGTPGTMVRWAVATEAARSIPLGALAPLLPPPRSGTALTGLSLIQQARAEFMPAAGGRVVLGIDDAHLLDDMSAVLIHQLTLSRTVTPLLTVRSGEPVPEPIAVLWKDVLPRIDLRPLSREQTSELLAAGLGGPVDGVTVERVWDLTQGNPLFVYELVADARRENGGLVRHGEVWSWRGRLGGETRLVELVRARLRTADQVERQVLEFLAFAEPLDLALLYRLASEEAILAADRKRLVSVDPEGGRPQVRLAHPLYGEIVRAEIGEQDARDRQRRLVRALAPSVHAGPRTVLLLAKLSVDADEPVDADVLTKAAEYAIGCSDSALGERLARAAIAAGAGFRARYGLALALMWQGRLTEAEAEFQDLEQRASSDFQRVQATFVRAEMLYWFLHRTSEAESVVQAAEEIVTDHAARCELGGLRSGFHAFSGQMDKALEAAENVLTSSAATEKAIAWAAAGATFAHGYSGRVPAARETNRRGWAIWERDPERHRPSWIPLVDTRFTSLWLGGELDEAAEVAEDCRRRALAEYSPLFAAMGGLWLGYVALAQGKPETARRWLIEAPAGLSVVDPGGQLHLVHLGLVQVHALLGDAASATRALAEARETRRPCSAFHLPYDPLAEAWVAAASGRTSRAAALARRSAAEAASMKLSAVEGIALHTSLRFGGGATVAPRLRALASAADSRVLHAYAAHAEALSSETGAPLEEAGAMFAELGMSLLAAEAYAQAAAVWDSVGERAAGLSAAARARMSLEACEGARTPLIDRLGPATTLTRREREVATLAAEGLTSKAIADRLSISARTVESHLDRVYAKLGISSRTELAKAWTGKTDPPSSR